MEDEVDLQEEERLLREKVKLNYPRYQELETLLQQVLSEKYGETNMWSDRDGNRMRFTEFQLGLGEETQALVVRITIGPEYSDRYLPNE